MDIVCSWKRFSHVNLFNKQLRSAWSKGVKCKFIIEIPQKNKNSEALLNSCIDNESCRLRFIPTIPKTIMTIFDKQQAILILDPKMGSSDSSAMLIQNPSLLYLMSDFFDLLWITAMENHEYKLDS